MMGGCLPLREGGTRLEVVKTWYACRRDKKRKWNLALCNGDSLVRVAGWLDDSKTIVVLMQLTSRGIENGWQASLVVAGRAAAAIWTCDLMHIELTIMRDYRKWTGRAS
jgi:hypothetical protein